MELTVIGGTVSIPGDGESIALTLFDLAKLRAEAAAIFETGNTDRVVDVHPRRYPKAECIIVNTDDVEERTCAVCGASSSSSETLPMFGLLIVTAKFDDASHREITTADESPLYCTSCTKEFFSASEAVLSEHADGLLGGFL